MPKTHNRAPETPVLQESMRYSRATRAPIEDKERIDLIPPDFLIRLANYYRDNAKRIPARNWEKGMPVSYCYRATITHLLKFFMRRDDEDHLIAAVWNLVAIIFFLDRIKDGELPCDLDDRPKHRYFK